MNHEIISVDFEQYRVSEEEFHNSIAEDDFSYLLSIGYERLKADKNNDGKVDKNEYIEFIESSQKINDSFIDYTFVGSVLIICLTALLITRIIFKRTK